MVPASPTATQEPEEVHWTPYSSFKGDDVFGLGIIFQDPPLRASISVREFIPVGSAAKPAATQRVGDMQETAFRKLTTYGGDAPGLGVTRQVPLPRDSTRVRWELGVPS
jgi:hypothetical protein